MRQTIDILKAMADQSRARILMALYEKELCVCHIVELLGLAPSTVSKHMSILRSARLAEFRKDGRWVYYRIPTEKECSSAVRAINWLHGMLKNSQLIRQDRNRLKHILRCVADKNKKR